MWKVLSIVVLSPALCLGQQWHRGVDADSAGSYADNLVVWHGANSPAVHTKPAKDDWPRLQLAGLGTYIYVFYGNQRDDNGKRFASFGRILPGPDARANSVVAEKPTWNGRTWSYRWGEEGKREMRVHFSNLMPGVQVETDSHQLILFNDSGKEPPSYAAFATPQGARARRLATTEPDGSLDCSAMSEPWLIVGFADSAGLKDVRYGGEMFANAYNGADCPWLIVLQHRARSLSTGAWGLKLDFDAPAGVVVMLPLDGRLLSRPEQTRGWTEGLPPDVVERARFWSRVARAVPTSCQEDFTFDAETGRITIRNTFTYRTVSDDWQTPALRIAPISPTAGIARMYAQTYQCPLAFDPELHDTGYRSQWGPYLCRVDADRASYRLGGLNRYLRETLSVMVGADDVSRQVLDHLQKQVAAFIALKTTLNGATWSPNENGPVFIGTRPEQVWALARTLPYLPPELEEKTRRFIRQLIEDDLLKPEHWQAIGTAFGEPAMSYRAARSQLRMWMDWRSPRVLYAMWAYAHHSGDWDVVENNWPLLRRAFGNSVIGQDWASGMAGQPHVPLRLNSGINGLIGFARMARHMEDRVAEDRAAYLLGKSMVAWLAQWKAPNYIQSCEPREEMWHALRVYGNTYGKLLPRLKSASGNYLGTRTQSWWPEQGFSWCTDPTLFSAPWSEIFLEASPELLRFYDDYFRDDIADQFDFVHWIWPTMFAQAFSYQTGLGEWGFASPYLRIAAFIKKESPRQLLSWLPDPQFAEDPFYLENLLAILYAGGQKQWTAAQ